MKKFQYKSLPYLLLAIGFPSLALATFPVAQNPMNAPKTSQMDRRLERYSRIDAEGRCNKNTGAGIDTQVGREYKSACMASYNRAKEVASKYIKDRDAAAAEIQAKTSQNVTMCGANRTPVAQKACFEKAAEDYTIAAELQKKMADDLINAYNEAQKLRDLNAEALKKYREDLREIEIAENAIKNRANTLRSQGDNMAAALTLQELQKPTVSTSGVSVAAKDGAATSITEYKQNFSQLTQEQYQSQDHASQFGDAAKAEASKLMQQSVDFQDMATRAREQAAKVTTAGTDSSNSGISDSNKIPVPGDGTAARAEYQAGKATGGSSGVGQKGISGASNTPEASTYDSSATNSSSAPAMQSTAPSPLTSAAAPAAMGASSSGVGAAQPSSASDPFAGMNTTPAYNNGQDQMQQTAQSNPRSANFGEALGTYDPRAKSEETETAAAEPEAKVEETPEQVAAAGGLSGDIDGESSGASSAPGIRGADGKPIRTGFSTANGGNLQSSRQSMDKDAASGGGFSPDLKSGAVSIAGSEMKSAVQSLAEELGATDLDLDLGDLTAEEKAALAPLEGGEGVRNVATARSGRRVASVQGSDGSIQDEQSMALFSRTRLAHERALKRGNLILGTRKKL